MNATTAKVIRFHQIGPASVLQIEDLAVPTPADNELRIKVKAIGLNRAEVMFREGAYLEQPELPSGLGYEASGIVDAVGDNVTGFKVGDSVATVPAFSMRQYGVYAEQAVVPVHAVVKNPVSFTAEQSTSIWMQYLTAYGALVNIGQLQQGQHLLVTAASSSVGVAAIQLGKSLGATVIAALSDKLELNSNAHAALNLCHTKQTPLGECNVAVLLEYMAVIKMALIVKMVVILAVNRCEFLQCSMASEPLHCTFSSSKWQM